MVEAEPLDEVGAPVGRPGVDPDASEGVDPGCEVGAVEAVADAPGDVAADAAGLVDADPAGEVTDAVAVAVPAGAAGEPQPLNSTATHPTVTARETTRSAPEMLTTLIVVPWVGGWSAIWRARIGDGW